MSRLQASIVSVRRRLVICAGLEAVPVSLAIGATLVLVLVCVRAVTATEGLLHPIVLGGIAVLAGLVGPGLWAWRTYPDDLATAVAIDLRLGFAERLATALLAHRQVQLALAEPAFAEAISRDAENYAARVVAARDFPLQWPSRLWLPLFPLAVAGGLFLGVSPRDLFERPDPPKPELSAAAAAVEARKVEAAKPEVTKAAEKLKESELAEKADREDLKKALDALSASKTPDEAAKALAEMERLARKPLEKPEAEKVRELKKALAARADSKPAKSPSVEKMRAALRAGEFAKAASAARELGKEFERLRKEEESSTPGSPEDKALKDQLAEYKKDLDRLAEELRKAGVDKDLEKAAEKAAAQAGADAEELKRALDELSKEETSEERKKELEKEIEEKLKKSTLTPDEVKKLLEKARKSCGSCDKAGKLAEKLNRVARSLDPDGDGTPNPDSKELEDALNGAGDQLSELEQLAEQLREAEAALGQIRKAKDGLSDSAGGMGGMGISGGSGTGRETEPGMGTGGGGPGAGKRETRPADYKTELDRVRGAVKGMKIVGRTPAEGSNLINPKSVSVTGEIEVGARAAAAMIKNDAIPSEYHEAVKRYYELSRDAALEKASRP